MFIHCYSGHMFTVLLPRNGPIYLINYSGFQPSCHNIKRLEEGENCMKIGFCKDFPHVTDLYNQYAPFPGSLLYLQCSHVDKKFKCTQYFSSIRQGMCNVCSGWTCLVTSSQTDVASSLGCRAGWREYLPVIYLSIYTKVNCSMSLCFTQNTSVPKPITKIIYSRLRHSSIG
jgi:hypothetical protein